MTPRTLSKRVLNLAESITYEAFEYVRRGAFERDKLLLATMLTFRILIKKGELVKDEVNALIKKDIALEPSHQAE
jgi:dynein heavy chain